MDTEASDDKGKQDDSDKPDSDKPDSDKPPLDASNEDTVKAPSLADVSLPMVRSYPLDLPTDPKELKRFNDDVKAITRRICGN